MEIYDEETHYLGNSKNLYNCHNSGLQNRYAELNSQEEKTKNDKVCSENVDMHCFDSNSHHNNICTEVRNIKEEVDKRQGRLGNLHSHFQFENTDKVYVFENTDSHLQDVNDGKFVDVINIKQEVKDNEGQMSELKNINYSQNMKYESTFEDELTTERSDSSLKTENSNLEILNPENIDFDNKFVKIEGGGLKTEKEPIINSPSYVGNPFSRSDFVPMVGVMMSPSDCVPKVDAILSPSEAQPHVLPLLTQSDLHSCHKKLNSEHQLTKHILQFSAFKCNLCDENFSSEFHLKEHLPIHYGYRKQSLQCHVCEKAFTSASVLKQHCISHSTERPHQCNVCDKRFKTVNAVKYHMVSHSTERPHQCNMCDKGFKTLKAVKLHMVIHSNERPHKCDMCDKGFKSENSLRWHIKSHCTMQLLECNVCDKRFKSLVTVIYHMRCHSTERPHQCHLCYKRFKTIDFLKKHMISHGTVRSHKLCI